MSSKRSKRLSEIDFTQAPNSNRKQLLVYRLNLAMIITMLVLLIMNILARYFEGSTITFGSTRLVIIAGVSFINLLLHHFNYYKISTLSLIFLPVFILFILPSLIGFVEVQSYFYYPYGIMGFSLIPAVTLSISKERISYIVAIIYYFILILISDWLLTWFSAETLEVSQTIMDFYLYYKVVPIVIFVLIQLSVFSLRRMNLSFESDLLTRSKKIDQQRIQLEERNEEIKQQRDSIEEQKELILLQQQDLRDSITFAERIQNAVLPGGKEMLEQLPEHFVLYKPRNIVSGDFYWVGSRNNKLLIAVADCTGHGIPGALMSMLGVSMIEEISKSAEHEDTGHFMNHLREHVIKTLKQNKDDHIANIGMDMSLVCIDPIKRTLSYTGANHHLYLVRQGELTITRGDSMSVGLNYMTTQSFSSKKIPYEEGDTIYMFSDGLPDQFGGPYDKKFGYRRLRELLLENQGHSMESQKFNLNAAYEDWRGTADQIDDIVIMGIRL